MCCSHSNCTCSTKFSFLQDRLSLYNMSVDIYHFVFLFLGGSFVVGNFLAQKLMIGVWSLKVLLAVVCQEGYLSTIRDCP